MYKVSDFSTLEIEGRETSGVIEWLLDTVGASWYDYPTTVQQLDMLEILRLNIIPEEGERLY